MGCLLDSFSTVAYIPVGGITQQVYLIPDAGKALATDISNSGYTLAEPPGAPILD